MNGNTQQRRRLSVVLHLVQALIVVLLLVQLWLFTVAVETLQDGQAPLQISVVVLICSLAAAAAVWCLLYFFLRIESQEF